MACAPLRGAAPRRRAAVRRRVLRCEGRSAPAGRVRSVRPVAGAAVGRAGRLRGAGAAVAAAAALLSLAACDPWHCSFESHGACVEFESPPADLEAARARMDRLLELELPFWNLHSLSGWRIQYRDTTEYVCYLATRNEGCTDYIQHTLSLHVPDDSGGCFEAAELLHELGHYKLGDPTHSNPRWKDVDAAFAGIVWDRPDAPAECRKRYQGIRLGMWPVGTDAL
ncbi:conserved hypothetical protein [Anaeromyxobacter dehalogenans 2CP-1]|uniref:Uncharacterized protein n=1 Tax=Anaeromyxobacter dehalogenans (strain ATCC BAA-258 / DSM 21875 / 2CP-1) TaxID=455488 RepID=B8JGQ1_ANAD2|nr:conserved hypothetical protein [Anaeromyxobacter dehalogenans 2CP-1]